MQKFRIEKDYLGTEKIPEDALWGKNGARVKRNYQISNEFVPLDFWKDYTLIKKASAAVNWKIGKLQGEVKNAIEVACDEILEGKFDQMFNDLKIDVLQSGGGTSTNMILNEILANRATQVLDEVFPQERNTISLRTSDFVTVKVHPNDHVNMSQSSNDTFPSCIRINIRRLSGGLIDELFALIRAFGKKANEFESVQKVARTHLMDAVPITLGSEFAAYKVELEKSKRRLEECVENLVYLNLGGTAVGTGVNAGKEFQQKIIEELNAIEPFQKYKRAENLYEPTESSGDFYDFAAAISHLAQNLVVVCNNLRLLSSGPDAGLGEITLPAVQAGSSIMPGKINPSIPEAMMMTCFRIQGDVQTIQLANQFSQLDLQVFSPIIGFTLNRMVKEMTHALTMLREKCVDGIEVTQKNKENIKSEFDRSNVLKTKETESRGYDDVSKEVFDSSR